VQAAALYDLKVIKRTGCFSCFSCSAIAAKAALADDALSYNYLMIQAFST